MKAWFCILLCWLSTAHLVGQPSNLVEILRQYQAQLDAAETGKTIPGPETTQAKPKTAEPPQVSKPSAPPAPATPPAQKESVGLQKGDTLKVVVVNEPEMSTDRVEVADDGTIRLPIAGPVKVVGLTIPEATETIRSFLGRDYLVNPRVQIERLAQAQKTAPPPDVWPDTPPSLAAQATVPQTPTPIPASPPRETCQLTILNQVAKPGTYQWPCDQAMTLFRAIGMAGGATVKADLERVILRRKSGGKTVEKTYDLRLFQANADEPLPNLQHGDEVEIPKLQR